VREIFSSPDNQMLRGGRGEGFEFLKAWAGTSLAFGIFISGGDIFRIEFLTNLLIAVATCGLGFVLHELAHRVVARNYGAEAHFFSNDQMLIISVLASFFFFIAAPGAVWHRGYLTPLQLGLVAIAGPVTNLTLGLLFFTVLMSAQILSIPGSWLWFLWIGYYINAWLGLFNLIPVDPFDGGKVVRWNKVVYGITVVIALFMVFGLPRVSGF
jgi:Zn-dependent protease